MSDEAVGDGEAAPAAGSNAGALGAREGADTRFHLILFEWRRRLFGGAAEMMA